MKTIHLPALGLAIFAIATLAACSSEPPPPQEPSALQRSIQEPLDKARAVEGQLQQQQQDLEKNLREADG